MRPNSGNGRVSMTEDQLFYEIAAARQDNRALYRRMALLVDKDDLIGYAFDGRDTISLVALAYEANPTVARTIHREILKGDLLICDLTKRLIKSNE